jgi:hypothetical protein
MANETKYTSFDLMKIFGIKKGSWYNVKNKFNLDLYSEQILDGKQVKFVYNQQAYEILKNNYQQKMVQEVKENPKMFSLIQENETLKAALSEYKQISSKFETMYNEERIEKENLIKDNATLLSINSSYIEKNQKLEQEKNHLQQELERLKNRGFFARLFNKK